jgi:hypothetical protein
MKEVAMKRSMPIVMAFAFAISGAAFAQSGGSDSPAPIQPKVQNQHQDNGAPLDLDPETIRKVKRALHQAGYDPGPVNGNWNGTASEALVNWQQAQGLEPTGKVDRRTLNALGIHVANGGSAGGRSAPPQGGVGNSGR